MTAAEGGAAEKTVGNGFGDVRRADGFPRFERAEVMRMLYLMCR
jgi:hypothetical protein